jgi:hypothetical protein
MNTYSLTNYNASGGNTSVNPNTKPALACGTIHENGNNGNGPGSFFIGLLISLAFVLARNQFRRHF